MTTVYSHRLAAVNLTAAGAGPTVTVPTSHTYVIRDVESRQAPSTTNEVLLREDSSSQLIILTVPATTNQGRSWTGHLVLEEGTVWHIQAIGAGAHVVVSGYDLVNPPVVAPG